MTLRPLITCLALSMLVGNSSAAEPDEFLKYAPVHSNTVISINVEGILASPRAQREGWASKDHTEYLAGAIPINPHLERIIVAKDFHAHSPTQGGAYAVAPTKIPITLESLVQITQGTTFDLADEKGVASPRGTLLFPLQPQLLGIAWSDNRQETARWLRAAKEATTSPLSPFLNGTIFNHARRNHIVIAIDSQDLFDAQQASLAVAMTKSLEGNKDVSQAVERFASGLRGVILAVNITNDGLAATARFESGFTGAVDANAFKAFVLEAMDRNGAHLEDAVVAKAQSNAGNVTLTFQLSDNELAAIMSLFLPPVPSLSTADKIAVAPQGVNKDTTARYIRAVNQIVDELQTQNRRARDFTKTAVWHDTAANKIATLSILNVDRQAIEYAYGTAERLRAIAESLRGVPVQAAMLESKAYVVGFMPRTSIMTWGGPRFNPWMFAGPQGVQTNLPQIRQQQADLIRKDEENRGMLWDQIEKQRSEIRRLMAMQYQIDTESKR